MDTGKYNLNGVFNLNAGFVPATGYLSYLGYYRRREFEYVKEMAPESNWSGYGPRDASFKGYGWLAEGLLNSYFIG